MRIGRGKHKKVPDSSLPEDTGGSTNNTYVPILKIVIEKGTRGKYLYAPITGYLQQFLVSTDNELGFSGDCTGNKFIIVGITTNGSWQLGCLNEFCFGNEEAQNGI